MADSKKLATVASVLKTESITADKNKTLAKVVLSVETKISWTNKDGSAGVSSGVESIDIDPLKLSESTISELMGLI